MPMHVTQGPQIPNHYQSLTVDQRKEAHEVIGKLEYADLWRGAGTLHKTTLVRVDMQGTIAGPPRRYNIQVQINGVKGHSTIAHADVSETLEVKYDSHQYQTNNEYKKGVDANRRGVAQQVKSALEQSLDHGQSYAVTGTSP